MNMPVELCTGIVGCYRNTRVERAVTHIQLFKPNISSVILSRGQFAPWENCVSRLCVGLQTRQTLCFQPIVRVIDPVIARFILFAHTPAMTTGAIEVKFRFVSGPLECIVEGKNLRTGEEGWHLFWYRRHRKRRAVNRMKTMRFGKMPHSVA